MESFNDGLGVVVEYQHARLLEPRPMPDIQAEVAQLVSGGDNRGIPTEKILEEDDLLPV